MTPDNVGLVTSLATIPFFLRRTAEEKLTILAANIEYLNHILICASCLMRSLEVVN